MIFLLGSPRGYACKSHGRWLGAPVSAAIGPCAHAGCAQTSKCLQFAEGKDNHAQKQPAMAETRDLRYTEGATGITNRNFNNLKIQLGRSENQVEVAKWVEIPEIAPIRHNLEI